MSKFFWPHVQAIYEFRFGVDCSAYKYLSETLEQLSGDVTRLVPLCNLFSERHIYCAVSRALIGRELLWFTLWTLCAKMVAQMRSELECYLTAANLQMLETEFEDCEMKHSKL